MLRYLESVCSTPETSTLGLWGILMRREDAAGLCPVTHACRMSFLHRSSDLNSVGHETPVGNRAATEKSP